MVAWRLFRRPTARYDANGSRIHMRKLHMETPADNQKKAIVCPRTPDYTYT